MRILLSCLQSLQHHAIAPYLYWRRYFVQGLEEAGHEVIEVPGVDWAEGMTYYAPRELDVWRSRSWEETLRFVREEHRCRPIDLYVGYFFPKQVDPAAVAEVQRMGIPCVNFYCDNVRDFVKIPEVYRPFALHWVPEWEALPMYRKAGLPHLHAPMPCWVAPAFRTCQEPATEPATFLGSEDAMRHDLLGRALRRGADFVIRGPGWRPSDQPLAKRKPARVGSAVIVNQIDMIRNYGLSSLWTKAYSLALPLRPPEIPGSKIGPTLAHDAYVRITREAKVTLGVNRVATPTHSERHPALYSRLRDIEAPMFGACYLTEWTAGLDKMYDLGTEIETYRDDRELTEKLAVLLQDAPRRRSMRERAQRKALAELSVGRSIARIADYFGL